MVRFSFIDALGVGHILAWTVSDVASLRPPPIRSFIARCASGDFWSSRATGVPHNRTARSVRVIPWVFVSDGSPQNLPPDCFQSVEVVVGHSENPEALSSMGRSNAGR